MWKSKKFIIIAVVLALVLAGTVAGVALAQTSSTTTPPAKTFAARVAAILGIEQQKVEDAFAQAKRDMADDALASKLDALVESGKMTQEQADKYKSWWQSRPEEMLPGMGQKGPLWRGFGGKMLPKLQPPPRIPAQ